MNLKNSIISCLYDFQYLTDIYVKSIESLTAALVDYTGEPSPYLTLKRTLVNRLTEAQTAAITAKNWTIDAVSYGGIKCV